MGERLLCKQNVSGSIPLTSTKFQECLGSSVVERLSEEQGVGGSIPSWGTITSKEVILTDNNVKGKRE